MHVRPPLRRLPLLAFLFSVAAFAPIGCVDDDEVFVEGRLESLCNEAIPICDTQARCVLGNRDFYKGTFPGGVRVIARTDDEDATLVVRLLLREMRYPGTEIQVQAYTPGCGDIDEEHPQDVDLFRLAGDDRILEFELALPHAGDHLVSVVSDMGADFSMTLTIE